VACPYFYPTKRLDSSAWAIPPRLPLGDPYAGECRAMNPVSQPDEDRLRKFCNLGYGSGSCDRFPSDSDSDAARFHVAKDGGQFIQIQYIFEKACWPFRQGSLEYSVNLDRFSHSCSEDILERQAAAFVESYLRRRA
jgi:hypothetical protein